MVRQISAFAVAMWLVPAWLGAQSAQFTITADSADVYKAPTTASPVIGHAPRGKVFQVARELGSWVRVSWPAADDGFAYLHVSTGSMTGALTTTPERASGPAADRSAAEPSLPAKPTAGSGLRSSDSQPELRRVTYVPTPVHAFGLGARIDFSHPALGGSARLWTRGPLGIQLEISRDRQTGLAESERLTSTQIAPSVLYSLRDQVSDYISMRPYVCAGVIMLRQTFSVGAASPDSVSDSSLGLQGFGGAEMTLSSLPHVAFSAELGYLRVRQPYLGADPGGFVVSVAAHWYVR